MDPHGYVDIEWHNNVLIVRTTGPFNVEGIQIAYQKIIDAVADKNLSEWHRVDFLDNATLGSPAVMKVIGRSYKWSEKHQDCHKVAVCCSNQIQINMMNHFVGESGFSIEVLSCVDTANELIQQISNAG